MARPPFKPSPDQRRLVQELTGIGVSQEDVLSVVPWGQSSGKPIDLKTLRKHFGTELSRGVALANMRIKRRAYELAEAGNVTLLIFLLKVRCGWRETVAVEASGPNGQPLPAAQMVLYLPVKDGSSGEPGHDATR